MILLSLLVISSTACDDPLALLVFPVLLSLLVLSAPGVSLLLLLILVSVDLLSLIVLLSVSVLGSTSVASFFGLPVLLDFSFIRLCAEMTVAEGYLIKFAGLCFLGGEVRSDELSMLE